MPRPLQPNITAEKLVAAFPDGIVSVDAAERIRLFNPAAERLFGYPAGEVVGQPLSLLFPDTAALRAEATPAVELTAYHKDGRPLVVEISHTVTRQRGRPARLLAVRERPLPRLAADFSAESLINIAPAIVLMLDLQGRIVSFNPYMEQLCGYRLEEVRGRDWFTTFLPERDRAPISALFGRAIGGAATRGNINPIVTKDGRERRIEWHDTTLHDASGTITGLLAIGQDVTEQLEAEAAVQELNASLERRVRERTAELELANRALESSRRFIERVANTAPDFIYVLDVINQRYIYANDTYERLLGLSRERLLSETGLEFVLAQIHPDDVGPLMERQNDLLAYLSERPERQHTGEVFEFEYRVRGPSGDWHWIHSWSVPFETAPDGRVSQVLGVAHDITERKHAEAALVESEARFRALAEALPAAVIVYRADGIRYVNTATEVITGYPREELLGHSFVELVHPDQRDDVARRMALRLGGDTPAPHFEVRLRTNSGIERWLDVNGSLINFEGAPAALGMGFDITERRRMEAALRESEARLALIFNHTSDMQALLSVEPDGQLRIAACNRRYVETLERFGFKLSPDDLIGKLRTDVLLKMGFPPEGVTAELEFYQRAIESGETVHFEQTVSTPVGMLYGEVTIVPVLDAQRRCTYVLYSLHDVTARYQAEERRNRSEARYQTLFESIHEAVTISGPDGRLAAVNPAAATLLGYPSPESMIGVPMARHYADPAQSEAIFGELLHAGYVDRFEAVLVKQDGSGRLVHVLGTRTLHRDAAGNVLGTEGIFTDITDRKQAEAALAESERIHRMVLANIDEIAYIVEPGPGGWPAGRSVFVSPRVEDILGYRPDDFAADPGLWLHAVHSDDLPALAHATDAIFISRQPGTRLYRMRHQVTGEYRWMEDRVVPELDSAGQVVRTFGVARDITARRQAQLDLQRQADELTTRTRILSAILQSLDLDALTQLILTEALTLLHVEFGCIHLVRGKEVVLIQWQGVSDNCRAQMMAFALDDVPAYLREAVIVHERLSERGSLPEPMKVDGLQTWATIPFYLPPRAAGVAPEWLGALMLGSHRYAAINHAAAATLEALASELALAVDHARAYRQSQERLARLQTLREIDRAIMHNFTLRDVLHVVLERVPRELGADAAAISLLDDNQRATRVFAMRLPNGDFIDEEAFTVADSLLHWFVERQEPVIINDLALDPRLQMHRQRIRNGRLISYLGVPLVVHDWTTGILHVLTKEPQVFTEEDVEFFRTLAGQTAIALKNALSADRLRESAARLAEAERIAHLGSWEYDPEAQVEIWSEELYRIFGVSRDQHGATYADFLNLVHPADRERVRRADAAALAGSGIHDLEYRIVRPEGAERVVRSRAELMPAEPGQPVRLRGTVQDITEQKLADQRLHENESRLQAVISNAPVILFALDREGRFTLSDGRGLQALGLTPGQVVGHSALELYRDVPDALAAVGRALAGEQFTTVLTAPGVALEAWYSPLRDEHGGLAGTIGVAVDITERRRTEEALRLKDHALASALSGIALADVHGNLTYVNASFLSLWGYASTADVRGRPTTAFWQSPETAAEVIASVLAEGKWFGRLEARRRDGSSFTVQLSASLITDEHGEPVGLFSSFVDVSAQDRAVAALRRSEARLTAAERVARLGHWDWNMVTNELHWSDEIYRIFGLAPQEFGATYPAFLERVHPDDRVFVEQAVEAAVQERESYSIDHRIVRPNGAERIVHEQGEVSYDAAGRAVRMLGVVQDVTEQRQAAQALRESETRLRLVISNMPLILFALDADGRFTFFEGQGTQALGFQAGQGVGQSAFALFADIPEFAAHFRRALAGETAREELTKFGITFEMHTAPVRNADGALAGLIGMAVNITERRRAEQQLAFQARLLEEISDAVVATDLNQRVTTWNAAAERMYGWKAREALGQVIDALLWTEFVEVTATEAQRELRERGEWSGEVVQQHRDGRVLYAMVSISLMRDAGGNLTGSVTVTRDITGRKAAEQALRESESKFRAVAETAPVGIVLYRVDRLIYVNPAIEQISGYPLADLLTKHFWDIIHPDFREIAQQGTLERLQGEAVPQGQDIKLITRGGGERWISVSSAVIQYEGQPTVLSVLFDNTARRQAEAALAEAEARYRAIVEDQTELVCRLRPDGTMTFVNQSYLTYFGKTLAEVLDTYVDSRDLDGQAATVKANRAALTTEQPIISFEEYVDRPDGTRHWIQWIDRAIFNGQGQITEIQAVGRDITQRKQIEAELRKLSNAVSQTADPVVVTAPDGTIEFVNAAFTATTGYSAAEAVGQTPRLLKSGVHPPSYYKKMWETLLAGDVWYGTLVNRRKDGSQYYAESNIAPVYAADGRIVNFVSVEKDITERIQREREMEAMVRVSAELRKAFSRADMLTVVLEQVMFLLNAEGAALAFRAEATGETTVEVGLGEWANWVGLQIEAEAGVTGGVITTGRHYVSDNVHDDTRIVRPEMHGRLAPALCVPLVTQERALGALWIGRATPFTAFEVRLATAIGDIAAGAVYRASLSEREARRRQESESLAAIGQALNSTLELDHVLQLIATAAQQIIPGVERAVIHLLDENTQTLRAVAGAGLPELGLLELGMRTGQGIAGLVIKESRAINVADTHTDPRYLPLGAATHLHSLLVVPVQSATRMLGTLSVQTAAPGVFSADDEGLLAALGANAAIAIGNAQLYEEQRSLLRERERVQSQLIQSEKTAALGRLVASLAHEINNPLQSVQGCLTLTQEELQGGFRTEKMIRYLEVAVTEIERISNIVRRLRDFYRPARTEMAAIRLHEVLHSVLELTHKQLQHANVTVERQWAADLTEIEANADHLKQVFLNLILNAVDAMPEGGTLTLRTTPDEILLPNETTPRPAVRVEFSDTGVGMPPEVLARLFEPFFTSKEQGTGLGLSVSYGIIRAHHGRITVASQVGQGTTFTMLLPVSQLAHGAADS
jgi:PAS domain S-box-containing protein